MNAGCFTLGTGTHSFKINSAPFGTPGQQHSKDSSISHAILTYNIFKDIYYNIHYECILISSLYCILLCCYIMGCSYT